MHKVTAPLVLAKHGEKITYVYDGGTLPEGVSQEDLDRLTALGMIEEFGAVEGDENGDGQVTAADTAALPTDAPKRSASKAVWADYSIKAGMDPAAVEAASRDDLIAAAAARFTGQG